MSLFGNTSSTVRGPEPEPNRRNASTAAARQGGTHGRRMRGLSPLSQKDLSQKDLALRSERL